MIYRYVVQYNKPHEPARSGQKHHYTISEQEVNDKTCLTNKPQLLLKTFPLQGVGRPISVLYCRHFLRAKNPLWQA